MRIDSYPTPSALTGTEYVTIVQNGATRSMRFSILPAFIALTNPNQYQTAGDVQPLRDQVAALQALIGASPPVVQRAPVLAGVPVVGQTLSVVPGAWGGSPPPVITYQWYRVLTGVSTPILGATHTTYALVTADIGYQIAVAEIAVNASASAAFATQPTAAVTAAVQTVGSVSGAPTIQSIAASVTWTSTQPTGYICVEDSTGALVTGTDSAVVGGSGVVSMMVTTVGNGFSVALYSDNTRTTLYARGAAFAVARDSILRPYRSAPFNKLHMNARDIVHGLGVNLDSRFWPIDPILTCFSIVKCKRVRATIGAAGSTAGYVNAYQSLTAAMLTAFGVTMHHLVEMIAYTFDATTFAQQSAAMLDAATRSGVVADRLAGPNELNGFTSHGPFDTVSYNTSVASKAQNAGLWAAAFHGFKRQNLVALANVDLVGACLATDSPTMYNAIRGNDVHLDRNDLHFYAGSGLQPSIFNVYNSGIGSFRVMVDLAQAQTPLLPVIMTECGATTSGGTYTNAAGGTYTMGNYVRSGVSQAQYMINQFCEYWQCAGPGGELYVYKLIDDGQTAAAIVSGMLDTQNLSGVESNFGLFRKSTSGTTGVLTAKPAATAIGAWQDLLSLGRNWFGSANQNDTAAFVPALDASVVTVTGITQPSISGNPFFVADKSDGSTAIIVWHEPKIDNGDGTVPATIASCTPTVNWGLTFDYQVFDPLGGTPLTAIASGSAATGCTITLQGSAKIIILATPAGYTQGAGDPRNAPVTGTAAFSALQSGLTRSATVFGGSATIPGSGWVPGNVLVVGVESTSAYLPTGPANAVLIGRSTLNASGTGATQVSWFTVPIRQSTQSFQFSNINFYGRCWWQEHSPFDTATMVEGTATEVGVNNSTTAFTWTMPDIVTGYRTGARLFAVLAHYQTCSGPSKNWTGASYGDSGTTGLVVVNKEVPDASGSGFFITGFSWEAQQSASGQAVSIPINNGIGTGDSPHFAGVVINPNFGQTIG